MGERKQRSDKKREVKPYVTIELKDMIYRLSYITRTPVKDICEFMVNYLVSNEKAINALSKYFKRNIRLNNRLYYGSLDNPSVVKKVNEHSERVTVRFKQVDYENISILSYALDCSVSRLVAILLEIALQDMQLINLYIKQYLNEQLTPAQMKELRNILSSMNNSKENSSSWLSLVIAVMEEVATPIIRTKEAFGEFLMNVYKHDE